MEKRAKQIKVPADVGRIPYKIATGEGFLDYTADQWKTFIMIYVTPIMWDLLDEADQQILTHFVMACFLLTARIIEDNALDEASLVEIRSFGCNTFWQIFNQFGHVIRPYFG